MSISASRVTRFGIGGGVWRPLDASLFANKEVGTPVVAEVAQTYTGGFWFAYEREMQRREDARAALKKKKAKAKKIKDDLIKALALEERKIEEDALRIQELKELTELVSEYNDEIKVVSEKVAKSAQAAIEKQQFSAMERLERELGIIREEELFLMQAAQILLNQDYSYAGRLH